MRLSALTLGYNQKVLSAKLGKRLSAYAAGCAGLAVPNYGDSLKLPLPLAYRGKKSHTLRLCRAIKGCELEVLKGEGHRFITYTEFVKATNPKMIK